MVTVEGIYKDGKVELSEPPNSAKVRPAPVVQGDNVNTGQPGIVVVTIEHCLLPYSYDVSETVDYLATNA